MRRAQVLVVRTFAGTRMISEDEIDLGLILHLEPDHLEAGGGSYSCPAHMRVKGPHFFLCTAADEDVAVWLPLYSNPGIGRVELSREGRSGHPKWKNGTFYYHPDQVWGAPHAAAGNAAAAGGDLSAPDSRNFLSEDKIPLVEAVD